MANLDKFLNKAGVSTLWGQIAAEVAKVDAKANTNAQEIASLKTSVEALHSGQGKFATFLFEPQEAITNTISAAPNNKLIFFIVDIFFINAYSLLFGLRIIIICFIFYRFISTLLTTLFLPKLNFIST